MLDSFCLPLSQYPIFEKYRTAKLTDLLKVIKFGKVLQRNQQNPKGLAFRSKPFLST